MSPMMRVHCEQNIHSLHKWPPPYDTLHMHQSPSHKDHMETLHGCFQSSCTKQGKNGRTHHCTTHIHTNNNLYLWRWQQRRRDCNFNLWCSFLGYRYIILLYPRNDTLYNRIYIICTYCTVYVWDHYHISGLYQLLDKGQGYTRQLFISFRSYKHFWYCGESESNIEIGKRHDGSDAKRDTKAAGALPPERGQQEH